MRTHGQERLRRGGPLVAAALGVLLMIAGGVAGQFGMAFLGCVLIIAAVAAWTWWRAGGSKVWKAVGFGFLAWIVTVPVAVVVAPPETTTAGAKVASPSATASPAVTTAQWAGPAIPEGTAMTADEWCGRYIEIGMSLYFSGGAGGLYPTLAEGVDPRQAFADLQAITDRRPEAAVFEDISAQIFPYRDRAFDHYSKAGYLKLSSLLTRVDLVGAAPVPRSSSTTRWWGHGGGADGLCFVAEPWVAVPASVTSGSGGGGTVTGFGDGDGCRWNGRPRATWKLWRWGDWSC